MSNSNEERREVDLSKLPKIYFNVYVAGMVRQRSDMEAINTDMLYFTLLLRMNHFAKEVYFQRKRNAPADELELIYRHLMLLRMFTLHYYEIPEPKWQMIQNEKDDDLALLDSLPVEEDPWGDKKTLDQLAADFSKKSDLSAGEETPLPAQKDSEEA
jgi:hypothetical protein